MAAADGATVTVDASVGARYDAFAPGRSLRGGDPVYVMIRPERIDLVFERPAGGVAMPATVAKRVFTGDVITFELRTEHGLLLRCSKPSVAEYRRSVGALVRRYRPLGVREWGAWNEVNHTTQPTWNSPKRAAQYFKTMRALCRGCTIVALDILDQAGATRYIQRFYRALGSSRRFARIVGIHNYSDTNRATHRGRGTRSIILAVRTFNRRTQFWMTETGGVVNFGRSFPCNEQRAAKSVSRMFGLARSYRRYIKRLYVYNWTGSDCNGFDTGLTKANGQLRPAYYTLRKYLRSFRR